MAGRLPYSRAYEEPATTLLVNNSHTIKNFVANKGIKMDELSKAIRKEVLKLLADEGLTPLDISNYNMARKAATGIFTIQLYKNTKTVKGDKKTIKVQLDNQVSTLVVALAVVDGLIHEYANKSFLQRKAEEQASPMVVPTIENSLEDVPKAWA